MHKKIIVWMIASLSAFITLQLCIQRLTLETSLMFRYSESLLTLDKNLLKKMASKEATGGEFHSNEILRKAPLNDLALLHLAVTKFANSDYSKKVNILKSVRARNIRRRSNLRFLANKALLYGDIEETLVNLEILYRIDFDNYTAYDRIISEIYETPVGRKHINAKLKSAPDWGQRLLHDKMKQSTQDSILFLNESVSVYMMALPTKLRQMNLTENYLNRLISFGYFEEARVFWQSSFVPDPQDENTNGYIFNPTFSNREVSAPFNWKIFESDKLISENLQGGGVFLSVKTSDFIDVAHQIFLIDPSKLYNLKVNATGNSVKSNNQGHFKISLNCMYPSRRFMSVNLTKRESFLLNDLIPFPELPDDCLVVDIRLTAEPSPTGKRMTIKVLAIDVINKSKL